MSVRNYVKGATVKRHAESNLAEEQARDEILDARIAAATEWAAQNDFADIFAFAHSADTEKEAHYADPANKGDWETTWPRNALVKDHYAINTLRNLAGSLIRWGQLTDKQAAFATRLFDGLTADARSHWG